MNQLASFLLPLAFTLPAVAQGPCSASLLGLGCGATVDVVFTPTGGAGNQRIDLTVHNLHPDALGAMAWGQTQILQPLGGGCNLLVEFQWGHIIKTDAQGDWNWSRVWPHSSMPGFYFIQFGSIQEDAFGNLQIKVSDAVRAECL